MEVLDATLVRNLSLAADRLVDGFDELAKMSTGWSDSLRLARACALALADQLAEIVQFGAGITAVPVGRGPS